MPGITAEQLAKVDWTSLPAPEDDGAAKHVAGAKVPEIALPASDGTDVSLAGLEGLSVVYAYPMTGRPGVSLPDGWDATPGARGCTPQACSFRDHYSELLGAGAAHVFGLSTQATDDQSEAVARLHLPFPLLSDAALRLTTALRLPVMFVDGVTLLRRATLLIEDGVVVEVFYPVFPPDKNVEDVLGWLKARRE